MKKITLGCLLIGLLTTQVYASFTARDDVSKWLNDSGDLGFTQDQVLQYLAQTKAKPSIVPVLRNAPENKLKWSGYQKRLVSASRIKSGKAFVQKNAAQLQRVAKETGVDAAIIAAIAVVLGVKGALIAIFFAALFAIIPSLYSNFVKKDIQTPFIPYLILGMMSVYFFDLENILKAF